MKVSELFFFIFLGCFLVSFVLSLRHSILAQKCLYTMRLAQNNSLFIAMITGEGAGFQHTRWILQILSNRMEIPEHCKPVVDKMKYNFQLTILSYIVLFILILLMYVAHRYAWTIK